MSCPGALKEIMLCMFCPLNLRCLPRRQTAPELGEKVHGKIKDNAINKIYNITNNAEGSSLILTEPYYTVCRFVLPGHFAVFIEIQHTGVKTQRKITLQQYC